VSSISRTRFVVYQLESHRQLGAGDGTRTRDHLLGRQALYQLSYSRATGILTGLQKVRTGSESTVGPIASERYLHELIAELLGWKLVLAETLGQRVGNKEDPLIELIVRRGNMNEGNVPAGKRVEIRDRNKVMSSTARVDQERRFYLDRHCRHGSKPAEVEVDSVVAARATDRASAASASGQGDAEQVFRH
jgi:hypothetical protein